MPARPSPPPIAPSLSWAAELRGALNATAAMLPFVLSYGFIVYGALGPAAAQVGLAASVQAVVLGGVALLLLGRLDLAAASPSASSCLILGAAVLSWLQDPALRSGPQALPLLLALSGATTALAGLCYLLLGQLRAGQLVRFVPQPVLAGFMNGVAALIVLSQLPPLLGVQADNFTALANLGPASAAALVTALATAVLVQVVRRLAPGTPAPLVALVVAALAVLALEALLRARGLASPLVHIGALRFELPHLGTLGEWFDASQSAVLWQHAPSVLVTAMLLALIGALETVLNVAAVDHRLGRRTDPNRLLMSMGAVNLLMGATGGLPVVYMRLRAIATHAGGGRSWRSVLASCVLLALVFTLGLPLIERLPTAVVAGIVVMLAWTLVDDWTLDRLRQWWLHRRQGDDDPTQQELTWSLLVVAVVCAVTVVAGFVTGVAVGVLLAMLLFVRALHGSLVRARHCAAQVPSRRVRSRAAEARLAPLRQRVQVMELEGALFFGNIDRLQEESERAAADASFLVLDLRRISALDASGAVGLARLRDRLASQGTTLLLAGVTPGNRHGLALRAHGVLRTDESGASPWQLFLDADHATEHAEQALLHAANAAADHEAIGLTACALFEGLDTADAQHLAAAMRPRNLAPGELVFAEGDPGDALYVLTEGSISVVGRTRGPRFVSFSPGMTFGEMAMLDGGGRTANAEADRPSTVHALTVDAMARIEREHPSLAAKVHRNLARHLSERLRSASGAWSQAAG